MSIPGHSYRRNFIRYEALAALIKALLAAYPSLSRDLIAGHSGIAPGRETYPGPSFDWAKLRASL